MSGWKVKKSLAPDSTPKLKSRHSPVSGSRVQIEDGQSFCRSANALLPGSGLPSSQIRKPSGVADEPVTVGAFPFDRDEQRAGHGEP